MIIKKFRKNEKEKAINIPPGTLISLFILIGFYILISFIEEQKAYDIKLILSFIPLLYSDQNSIKLYHLYSPLTYILIHGNIFHLIINLAMLSAFGSGIENKFGKINFFLIFLLSSIAGIFTHYLFYKNSYIPVIGSSGGISGLFGFYLIHLLKTKNFSNFKILQTIVSIIIIFFIFSLIDIVPSINSSEIAWVVHMGGFLTGVVMYYFFRLMSAH